MNILIVVPGGIDPSGETKVIPVLLSLYKELNRHHNLCVLTLNQEQQLTEYRLDNYQVISLPKVRKSHKKDHVTQLRLALKRIKNHGFKPEVIHSFWLGRPALFAALISKIYQTPLIATLGGGEPICIPDIHYGGSCTTKNKFYQWLSWAFADHITMGSAFVKNSVANKQKRKANIIPLGIDTRFWTLKNNTDTAPKRWNLLHLASINRVKNPWLMLQVASSLKEHRFNYHLNWYGVDTLDGAIQRESRKMGLHKHVTFGGFKTQKELKPILQQQHFIVQTSHYESQGIAMVEACSQGVCPVGTDVGWLSDINYGIRASSKQLLAEKICAEILQLAQNSERRFSRVKKAQDWISRNNAERTAQRFTEIYQTLS